MSDLNHFSGIVKIIENPIQSFSGNRILTTTFRVELPQFSQTKIVNLIFWGNLVNEVKNYYQVNDYILIEGYISVEKKSLKSRQPSKIVIVVLNVHPFLLKSNIFLTKDFDNKV